MSPGSAGQVEMCERRDKALRGCENSYSEELRHPAYAILSLQRRFEPYQRSQVSELDVLLESQVADAGEPALVYREVRFV